MQTISWKCLALIAIALCSLAMAVPVPQESEDSPNPVVDLEGVQVEKDLTKRAFGPDVGFGIKNAILGYVFGKIDGILDAKTQALNAFDATNAAKNAAAGITPPVPITSLQQLLSAVIQPKIAAITAKFGALSGSSAGGLGGLSGGSSGGGNVPVPSPDSDDATDDHADLSDDGAVVASGGSGNIISSFLKLSGPILSSSSAGAKGGQLVPVDDNEE
ncbi:uncharacterized protein LOC129566225 [Sitodiplosis mosellana]|uniref:uncharacterized protein LOC129566225 n=1 Tax=Sitodiplosis mosellana TaxID=263140 RepID=UPI002444219E|nr:uncharacterized protein LOC129566225 [Sitodiplosis mosellana]XP_055297947.1 uncharacterized protein LOC129566225 [Sitodiplosis mosellana]XP_055297948.1 uncharacterized protein LOC129566225 [Sitodiplosis mosellana]XP_055297949.1 uncharacterized protein LOC129566225 [Sitodiplosis mosellana]